MKNYNMRTKAQDGSGPPPFRALQVGKAARATKAFQSVQKSNNIRNAVETISPGVAAPKSPQSNFLLRILMKLRLEQFRSQKSRADRDLRLPSGQGLNPTGLEWGRPRPRFKTSSS